MQSQLVAVKIEANRFDQAIAEADGLRLQNGDKEDEKLVNCGGRTVALAVFGCVDASQQPIVLVGFDGGKPSQHWFRYFSRYGEVVQPPSPQHKS